MTVNINGIPILDYITSVVKKCGGYSIAYLDAPITLNIFRFRLKKYIGNNYVKIIEAMREANILNYDTEYDNHLKEQIRNRNFRPEYMITAFKMAYADELNAQ